MLVQGRPEKEERCANQHADHQDSRQAIHKTQHTSSLRGCSRSGPGPGLAWLLDRHCFRARGEVIRLRQAKVTTVAQPDQLLLDGRELTKSLREALVGLPPFGMLFQCQSLILCFSGLL